MTGAFNSYEQRNRAAKVLALVAAILADQKMRGIAAESAESVRDVETASDLRWHEWRTAAGVTLPSAETKAQVLQQMRGVAVAPLDLAKAERRALNADARSRNFHAEDKGDPDDRAELRREMREARL